MTLHAAQRAVERKRKPSRSERLRKRRDEAAERQGWRCYWCGGEMQPIGPDGKVFQNTVTVEHIKALADGGDNRRENLVAAHMRCNNERGSEAARRHNFVQQYIHVNGLYANRTLALRLLETFGQTVIQETLRAARVRDGGADA